MLRRSCLSGFPAIQNASATSEASLQKKWLPQTLLNPLAVPRLSVFILSAFIIVVGACSHKNPAPPEPSADSATPQTSRDFPAQMSADEAFRNVGRWVSLPAKAAKPASSAFWDHWGDGQAELSHYDLVTPRYGQLRDGELVLIFVTEPMDRRRWIKDDTVQAPHRVEVLKMNMSVKFQTGVYPYSILLSTFSPVGTWREYAFAPAKMTLSVQEWCGHVFHAGWIGPGGILSHRLSYFASEGQETRIVEAPDKILYEDGLWVQVRELDGPFLDGQPRWKGKMMPSLWRLRREHQPTQAVEARIERTSGLTDSGDPISVFRVTMGDYLKTIEVEKAPPHRVLAWTTSEGESARLTRTERLPYWRLNREGDESKFPISTP